MSLLGHIFIIFSLSTDFIYSEESMILSFYCTCKLQIINYLMKQIKLLLQFIYPHFYLRKLSFYYSVALLFHFFFKA